MYTHDFISLPCNSELQSKINIASYQHQNLKNKKAFVKEEHLGAKSKAHLMAAAVAAVMAVVVMYAPLLTSNELSREWREVVWPNGKKRSLLSEETVHSC